MAAILVGCLAASGASAAEPQDPAPAKPAPKELMEEGMRSIFRALELLIQSIPQYESPEVLENGDIIIRRRRDDPAPRKSPDKPRPEERT